jgi:hypothetical protein
VKLKGKGEESISTVALTTATKSLPAEVNRDARKCSTMTYLLVRNDLPIAGCVMPGPTVLELMYRVLEIPGPNVRPLTSMILT